MALTSSILHASPLASAVFGVNGACVDANDAYAALVGLPRTVLLAQHRFEHWGNPRVVDDCREVLHSGQTRSDSCHDALLFGRTLWLQYHMSGLEVDAARQVLVQFVDLDQSDRSIAGARNDPKVLRNLLNNVQAAIALKDLEGRYLVVNEPLCRRAGLPEEDFIGKTESQVSGFSPEVNAKIVETMHQVVATKRPHKYTGERVGPDGLTFYYLAITAPFFDQTGAVVGVSVVATDITAQRRLEETLKQLAFHDVLTQLPNRRLLLDRLRHARDVSRRTGNHIAVLFLDLNKFKQLNDTHGHEAGDLLLVEVARRLKTVVRDADTAARLGGDEFVVLLEGLSQDPGDAEVAAKAVAEKIRKSLAQEYELGGISHVGTASIGIKLVSNTDSDPEAILKAADQEMYSVKKGKPSAS